MFSIGELFAGIGGFSLAFHATGQAQTAWFVERDLYCQQVLRKHWSTVPVYGDIYDCHDLPYVDVVTAGFPCQPFSVAGKREGEKDERYLVPEMFRVIQEVRPHVVLFENVPGFTSIAAGNTFKQFLRALAESGYDAEWHHLAAADIGAPHKRERWFCVAYAQQWRNSAVTARQKGQTHPDQKRNSAKDQFRRHSVQSWTECPDVSFTKLPRFQGWQPTKGCQSRLGRGINGLPHRLDRHQWPAGLGQPQYAWEPPHTTTRQENRVDRVKALGNAVVPQVVYPIAQSICEWLAQQDLGD